MPYIISDYQKPFLLFIVIFRILSNPLTALYTYIREGHLGGEFTYYSITILPLSIIRLFALLKQTRIFLLNWSNCTRVKVANVIYYCRIIVYRLIGCMYVYEETVLHLALIIQLSWLFQDFSTGIQDNNLVYVKPQEFLIKQTNHHFVSYSACL